MFTISPILQHLARHALSGAIKGDRLSLKCGVDRLRQRETEILGCFGHELGGRRGAISQPRLSKAMQRGQMLDGGIGEFAPLELRQPGTIEIGGALDLRQTDIFVVQKLAE
jgi:hypothetical protein